MGISDPEILARIKPVVEMAYRMQTAVPEVMNINCNELNIIKECTGGANRERNRLPPTNCLLGQESSSEGWGTFVQLVRLGMDSHGDSSYNAVDLGLRNKCKEIGQHHVRAYFCDLKQRGLLDETLVVWGGEFGRTPMQEKQGRARKLAF